MAYDATRKIITAAPQITETLLVEFMNFLSVLAEKLCISKTRYTLVLIYAAFFHISLIGRQCLCFFNVQSLLVASNDCSFKGYIYIGCNLNLSLEIIYV